MPIHKWTMLLALSLGLVAVGSGRANAGLIGSVVHGRYLFPDSGTTFLDEGTQTIANGTVFGSGSLALLIASFSDTQITLTNTSPTAFAPASFSGPDFAFLSGPAITSVTEDATSSPLFALGSVLTFTGNDIRVNIAGACGACVGEEKIILDVTTASAVPEPAAIALFGVSLLGLGIAARRKPA